MEMLANQLEVSAYVSICQHMSAYVSIRQLVLIEMQVIQLAVLAYVSILSIRQHMRSRTSRPRRPLVCMRP